MSLYSLCPSVSFGFVTQAPQWTAVAVLCAVTGVFTAVTACGLEAGSTDACHMLAHRADIVIFGGVVMEVVVIERVGLVTRVLLEVEAVVFDVSLHAGFDHKAVVLFGAIAIVGHCY